MSELSATHKSAAVWPLIAAVAFAGLSLTALVAGVWVAGPLRDAGKRQASGVIEHHTFDARRLSGGRGGTKQEANNCP